MSKKTATGKVLRNADIILMFWGAAWNNATTTPPARHMAGAILSLTTGAYFSALNQYDNIGLPRLTYVGIDGSSNPPNPFTDSDITNYINSRITAGRVPQPNAAAEQIFAVLVPPGVKLRDPLIIRREM